VTDLETFVLDPANRVAATAAREVADASGVPYAPLVIVGPPGTGKTELLSAIAARVRANHPDEAVELLDPDRLAEQYRLALLAGRGEEYRAGLFDAPLVLFDDIERLVRHRDCQGLVADLLDARRNAGREVVVASSVALERLEGFDARLVRRLGEGTTVELALPGPEARLVILRRRLASGTGTLHDDVVRAVAEAEFASMRDYTGGLARLIAFQEASAVPLSPEDALLLIGAPVVPSAPPVPPLILPAAPAPGEPDDEFGTFLSEVTASLSEQVDRWRRRVGDAVLRWGGEGLRTRRLEALLQAELPADPEPILAAYQADAKEIQALAAEAALLAPDLIGAEVFRDPDQVAAARALVDQARSRTAPLSAPLSQYRWSGLAEGPTSRLAMMAGRDIILEPGRRYSPLVVVGGPGTGKTHFLHALGNALAARGVTPVACLGSPAFAAEVRAQSDTETLTAWRHRYRWVGALLLDDLHLLTGEPRAQEELALLVAELVEGERQMIFSTSLPLDELSGLGTRLLSNLHTGLVVELPAPDREVRLAVVKGLLAGAGVTQEAALADYLAGRPAESVRDVQALVRRVLLEAEAQQVEPSPSLAREVLEVMDLGLSRGPRRSGPTRASGIRSPGLGLVKSREKTIDVWPAVTDRLMTELR